MTTIHIIKNGKHARTMSVEVRGDKTLWAQSSKTGKSPMVSRVFCERLGLNPQTVLKAAAPAEALMHLGENEGNVLILTDAEYREWRKTNELSPTEKRNLLLEGLGDLEAAYDAWQSAEYDYRDGFNRMMEDEHNDGARPPRKPGPELEACYGELKALYPRAALYLRAERQHDGAHWADNSGKGAAGKQAMELVLAGATEAEVLAALEARRDNDIWGL